MQMISFVIVYNGKTICMSTWKYLPRIGEVIRLQGKLYTITNIIHDIDAMNAKNGCECLVEVK